MSQTFQLQHVNANSLRSRAKQHNMQSHLSRHKPHVMLVSETHLSQQYQPTFDKYIMNRTDRVNNGGGTAVLINENIPFEMLQNPSDCDIECTIAKIKINTNKSIVCIAAYIPDQTLKYEHIDQLMRSYGPNNIILGADLNAKHLSWRNQRNNPNGNVLRRWADENSVHFQVLFPNEPTCLRAGREPSTLDCFIVSNNLLETDQTTIKTLDFESDHRAIELELIFEQQIQTIEPQTAWNWSRCNWNDFNIQIERELSNLAIPENRNIDKRQIDKYVDKIEHIFQSTLANNCPKIKLNRTKLIKLSDRSTALIKRKNLLRRKLFSNRNCVNYLVIEKPAKTEIKLLNCMIRNSIAEDYRSHFIDKIKSISTSNHNLFSEIQQISSYKKRDKLPNIMLSNDETETYSTNLSKANGFAKQFASINDIRIEEDDSEFDFQIEVEDTIDEWFEQNENKTIVEFSNETKASDPYQSIQCDNNDPLNF